MNSPRYRCFVDYYRRHVCRVLHACDDRTGTKIAGRLIVFWQASVPRRSPSLNDITILGGTCSSYFPAEYNTDSSNRAREFHCTNVPPRWQRTSGWGGAPCYVPHVLSARAILQWSAVRSKCEEFHVGSARYGARCAISSLRAVCRKYTAKYSSEKNQFPWC